MYINYPRQSFLLPLLVVLVDVLTGHRKGLVSTARVVSRLTTHYVVE